MDRRPPASKFRRLAITHALMMGGDAAMVVALADSLFFNIDLDAARSRVMLFLALSFAPFLVIAPLIGPLIDRVAGGRRLVIQLDAAARVVLMILMASNIDNLALFPLVFASLVLQKTYIVSKSALVPSTVRTHDELVEANSKLGLIAGITGAVAVVPAGILLKLVGAPATLWYGAIIFGAAVFAATTAAARGRRRTRCRPGGVDPADRIEPATRRDRHDRAAGQRRLHVLPPRVLAALAGPGCGVVRRGGRRGRAGVDGRQRDRAKAAPAAERGVDAERLPRRVGRARGSRWRCSAVRSVRSSSPGS